MLHLNIIVRSVDDADEKSMVPLIQAVLMSRQLSIGESTAKFGKS
jgi:hypothetical protein